MIGDSQSRRALQYVAHKLLGADRFSEPVRLNFNKKDQFSTVIGLLITLMCYTVVAIYGVQRF